MTRCSIMASEPTRSLSPGDRNLVFISYSHADARWLKPLRVHLKPLERLGAIELWDDTRIKAGTAWRQEIRRALERARVAVLLVSADFLASDFIASNELQPLLKGAEERGTLILPLIIRHCRFEQTEGLARFQAVNDPSRPLATLHAARREKEWVKLSGIIEDAVTSAVPSVALSNETRVASERTELAKRHVLRYRFWQQLLELAKNEGLQLHAKRAPTTTSWIGAGAGISGYSWNYVIWMSDAGAVELDIDTGDKHKNKSVFDALHQRKAEIEASFGAPLEWERLDDRRRSGIQYIVRAGGLTAPEEQWPAIQAALVQAMTRLSRTLYPYLLESQPEPERRTSAPSSLATERAQAVSQSDQDIQRPDSGTESYYHPEHAHWDECILDENGNCINDNQKHWGSNE